MPVLGRDPARGLRREAQTRRLDVAAGEDAVAGAEMRVELGVRHFVRLGVDKASVADGVDGEAAQVLSPVAPGVEVPVVAVVHEPLRRHFALGLLAASAVVVADPESGALEHRGGGDAEMLRVAGAALGSADADALPDVLPRVIARA